MSSSTTLIMVMAHAASNAFQVTAFDFAVGPLDFYVVQWRVVRAILFVLRFQKTAFMRTRFFWTLETREIFFKLLKREISCVTQCNEIVNLLESLLQKNALRSKIADYLLNTLALTRCRHPSTWKKSE